MKGSEKKPSLGLKSVKSTTYMLLGIALLSVMVIAAMFKFWNKGTLKFGSYYINGWTPFNNTESYFYFGKFDRDRSLKNLIGLYQTPSPAPLESSPQNYQRSDKQININFSVPTDWKLSYGGNGYSLTTGDPNCSCVVYECYLENDVCPKGKTDDFARVDINLTSFCKSFEAKFKSNETVLKNCKDFSVQDFVDFKDFFFADTYTGFVNSSEDCGPFNVYAKPFITKVDGYTAIVRDQGESCGFPKSGSFFREYYIFIPNHNDKDLIEIDFHRISNKEKLLQDFEGLIRSADITEPAE